MSTHTKAKSKAQFRHPASRGKSHERDKREGEKRRETAWIGVDAPSRPSPARRFPGLAGHEYRHDGQAWQRCVGPEEFADYIETEAKRRSHYMSVAHRRGVAVPMKRPVGTPVEIQTTTFAPWLSDWTAAELAAGRDVRPKLAALRNRWLEQAQALLAGSRHVLGYAFHCDTDDPHFDLILSRQDGNGGRIGETGLRLVGPWCVGCERQVRAGATIRVEKRNQLRRAIANFRHRYGADAKPLDVSLARALDTAADEVLGEELRPFREAYAARVPELERAHAAAQLAVVEDARAKLLPQAAQPPPQQQQRGLTHDEDPFPSLG